MTRSWKISRQTLLRGPGATLALDIMDTAKAGQAAGPPYSRVSTQYVEMLSSRLLRMKNIDEGNGSLLDNTIVMFGSGMKYGNDHVRENLPIILAGKGQDKIATGRRLICQEHTPLADLHLTLAQKLGLEMDGFNGATQSTIAGI